MTFVTFPQTFPQGGLRPPLAEEDIYGSLLDAHLDNVWNVVAGG
jgi:hypothetical protein